MHFIKRYVSVLFKSFDWSSYIIYNQSICPQIYVYAFDSKDHFISNAAAICLHSSPDQIHCITDTTPPVLSIVNKPDDYSNENIAEFRWQCMEPCTTVCSVSYIANTYPVVCSSSTLHWTLPTTISNITYRMTITAFDEVRNANEKHFTWISGNIIYTF
jgi:hypothetical protein